MTDRDRHRRLRLLGQIILGAIGSAMVVGCAGVLFPAMSGVSVVGVGVRLLVAVGCGVASAVVGIWGRE